MIYEDWYSRVQKHLIDHTMTVVSPLTHTFPVRVCVLNNILTSCTPHRAPHTFYRRNLTVTHHVCVCVCVKCFHGEHTAVQTLQLAFSFSCHSLVLCCTARLEYCHLLDGWMWRFGSSLLERCTRVTYLCR